MEVREKGDYFGEVSLMTGEPAAFTIVAVEPTRVLMIPDDLFSRWVASDPKTRHLFARSMGRRMVLLEEDLKAMAELEEAKRSETDPYGLELQTREPMRILVINARRTSLKFAFFDTVNESHNVEGQIVCVDEERCELEYRREGVNVHEQLSHLTRPQEIKAVLERLCDPNIGVIRSIDEITAVGHRVVHGGDRYNSPMLLTDKVIEHIASVSHLAPFHNPMHLEAIHTLKRILPDIPHIAVFDTAFHQTIPAMAHIYGVPYDLYTEDKIRRYGFHGPSHQYVALRAAAYLGRPWYELKIISCHLGEGGSICAIDHGRSIDNSMGLTPLVRVARSVPSTMVGPLTTVWA